MTKSKGTRRPGSAAILIAVLMLLLAWSGPSAPAAGALRAPLPGVSAVAPASGPTAGGTRVKITGSNFANVRGVYFGTTRASALVVTSPTTLLITTPPHAAGSVNVKVVTAAGGSTATTKSRFAYVAAAKVPAVTAISPKAGDPVGGTVVTISGTAFTGATSVTFGTAAAAAFTVVSATSIRATSPGGSPGSVDVRVTTPAGTSPAWAGDLFTYTAPVPRVSAIAPASGPQAGGTSVTLTGTLLTGTTSVSFGGVAAAAFTVIDDSTIVATSPSNPPGAVDVAVTTPVGVSTPSAATQFTYLWDGPTVTRVAPDHGSVAGGTTVEITGTGLAAATAVDFGDSASSTFTVNSDTSITALAPPGTVGPVDVRVTTDRRTPVAALDVFTYVDVPVISAVTPATGPTAGGTTVTITGTGFLDVSGVTLGGSQATGLTVVSPTTLTVVTPGHSAGAVDVVVTTALGSSNAGTFTYVANVPSTPNLVAGTHHSCRLDTTGGVTCWGWNGHGQLGDGTTTSRSRPVPVAGLTSGVVRLAAGGASTCAVLVTGRATCWGWNAFGQLGDGTRTDRSQPVTVPGITDAVDVTVGNGHVCALRATGQVLCMGWNFYGQLGDGTTADHPKPTPVQGLVGVTSVSAGDQHTCARTAVGAALCWGANALGQLGDGTTTNRSLPAQVSGFGSGVTILSAGVLHTCAVRSGAALCWGRNVGGEIGDGTTVGRSLPVPVVGMGAGVTQIDADGYTCAVGANVRCWGKNTFGGLGNGSTLDSSTPVAVGGLPTAASAIAVGTSHACALVASGAVYCWGDNAQGQLGDGSTANRTTAVLVRP